jgi:hypothetical protein
LEVIEKEEEWEIPKVWSYKLNSTTVVLYRNFGCSDGPSNLHQS